MAAKAPFVSEKLAKRKRLLRNLRIIFYTIIFVALLFLVWWFSHAKAFQITDVVVEGAEVVSVEDVEADAHDLLTGSYVFVFPKKHIFWYPKNRIEKFILTKYTRIQTVDVSRKGLEVIIATKERTPKYVWCGETAPLTNEEAFSRSCYFVDESGFIFATAPNFSDAVFIKLYSPIQDIDAPINGNTFTRDSLARIDQFASSIKNEIINPIAYVQESDLDVAVLLLSRGENTPKVIYDLSADPVNTITAFRSAVATEPLATKLKKSFNRLEYIDARFDKKIFYKFAESEKIEQTANLNDEAGATPQ